LILLQRCNFTNTNSTNYCKRSFDHSQNLSLLMGLRVSEFLIEFHILFSVTFPSGKVGLYHSIHTQ